MLSVKAAMSALSTLFGGFIRVKNPFALNEAQREERFHLLLINVTVVFATGLTFAQLLADPRSQKLIAPMRKEHDSEPLERKQRHFDAAMAVLTSPVLAKVLVNVCCEVQFTFDYYAEIRAWLHYCYDVSRAADCYALYANFAADNATQEVVPTTMKDACELGYLSVVKQLALEQGEDVNVLFRGASLVLLAVDGNNCDVLGFLLEHGADVDVGLSGSETETPLCRAAHKGHGGAVQQLLNANADVNKARSSQHTPLHLAAGGKHAGVVQQLLNANADVNKATPKGSAGSDYGVPYPTITASTGTTPLLIAANLGDGDVVQLLLDANANVNKARLKHGHTPLYTAAENGHAGVVRQLLNANADVNKASVTTVIDHVTDHGPFNELTITTNHTYYGATSDGQTPLFIAARKGHADVVRQLLDANADVNKARIDGVTPLAIAAHKGHAKIVKMIRYV